MKPQPEYVGGLGIDWCTKHDGIRNEDETQCDYAAADDECDLYELFYRKAKS